MDYVTVSRVKAEARIHEATDDALLAMLVTSASRAIDRHVTGGVTAPDSDNYLALATLTDEVLTGWLNSDGNLVFYTHKPRIASVAALSYRPTPADTYAAVDTSLIVFDGSPIVTAYTRLGQRPAKLFGRLTYTGGLAASVESMPADIVEAATMLVIRYYREAQAGMSDEIGVTELGTIVYSNALPRRAQVMLAPYVRSCPWRHPG